MPNPKESPDDQIRRLYGRTPQDGDVVEMVDGVVVRYASHDDHLTVPLVVYSPSGERKVIGEATIKGEQIIGVLGTEAGEEVISQIFRDPGASFSIGFAPPQ